MKRLYVIVILLTAIVLGARAQEQGIRFEQTKEWKKILKKAKKEKKLIFIDCYTSWCGPCKMMHPVLEGLKKQLGERVKIVKIDIDSPVNRQLVNSYQVQAVPQLMLFKAGKMVWRQSGAMQATQIRQVIEKYL